MRIVLWREGFAPASAARFSPAPCRFERLLRFLDLDRCPATIALTADMITPHAPLGRVRAVEGQTLAPAGAVHLLAAGNAR